MLLRSVRIATDPRKLVLAALAVALLWIGEVGLSKMPFAPQAPAPVAPWNAVAPALLTNWGTSGRTVFAEGLQAVPTLLNRLLMPLGPLADVTRLPFQSGSTWTGIAYAWTRLFWSLAVWSLFGGAIARIAAVEFARDERPSLLAAIKFAGRRFLSLFSAPLLPMCGVLFVWTLCALGGLAGRIPTVGPWIVALFWGLALLAALLLVAVVVATVAGWPLMVAGIATEGSDAFDGFSRSFSYLYGRPWRLVGLAACAVLLGLLAVAVFDTVAVGVAAAAAHTVATGMGGEHLSGLLHGAEPGYFRDLGWFNVRATRGNGPAAIVAGFWLTVLAMVAVGFAASYFWSAATVVYFLLRKADDGTHLDEVFMGEADEIDNLLPLAGIAATGQPVTERSHHPTVQPPTPTVVAD